MPNAEAGTQPKLLYPPYTSTILRAPEQPLIRLPQNFSDLTAPVYGYLPLGETDNDLDAPARRRAARRTHHRRGPGRRRGWPAGAAHAPRDLAVQRGRPVLHARDDHPAPLDPNFSGAGRMVTDAQGQYQFTTIKPGAYPWRNHHNAWRPAHIHFSVFGTSFQSRLVTQMYFPNDPLFPFDPIMQSVPDARARERLVSKFDMELTTPEWALGYRFDIVLRGRDSTPFEGRT